MSNIYRHSEETYFQLSKSVVEAGILKAWSPASQTLYTFLLYEAQERSSSVVIVDTSEVVEHTGLSKYKLNLAREELSDLGLVQCYEITSGRWRYAIQVKRSYKDVDFDTLTRDELEPWFLARLDDLLYSHGEDANGLRFKCPFCSYGKRREFPLSVKLVQDNTPGLGAWHCFACGKGGKLVEMERLLARRGGEEIDYTEAHNRVGKSLLQLRQRAKDEEIRAEALAVL